IHELMKRAWRYRTPKALKLKAKEVKELKAKEKKLNRINQRAVLAAIPFAATEVNLYKNRKETAENLAVSIPWNPKKHPDGLHFSVRYATSSWILVKYGGGHEWYFLKASYKHIKLNPDRPWRKKVTQTLTPSIISPAWA